MSEFCLLLELHREGSARSLQSRLVLQIFAIVKVVLALLMRNTFIGCWVSYKGVNCLRMKNTIRIQNLPDFFKNHNIPFYYLEMFKKNYK